MPRVGECRSALAPTCRALPKTHLAGMRSPMLADTFESTKSTSHVLPHEDAFHTQSFALHGSSNEGWRAMWPTESEACTLAPSSEDIRQAVRVSPHHRDIRLKSVFSLFCFASTTLLLAGRALSAALEAGKRLQLLPTVRVSEYEPRSARLHSRRRARQAPSSSSSPGDSGRTPSGSL